MKHYKLENKNFFESIYKNGKNNYKIWRHWNRRTKISPISKIYSDKKIDINNIVVSNKTSFGKKVLNVSLAIKMLKKLDVYAYFFQKWVHAEKTLRKLNICLSW